MIEDRQFARMGVTPMNRSISNREKQSIWWISYLSLIEWKYRSKVMGYLSVLSIFKDGKENATLIVDDLSLTVSTILLSCLVKVLLQQHLSLQSCIFMPKGLILQNKSLPSFITSIQLTCKNFYSNLNSMCANNRLTLNLELLTIKTNKHHMTWTIYKSRIWLHTWYVLYIFMFCEEKNFWYFLNFV